MQYRTSLPLLLVVFSLPCTPAEPPEWEASKSDKPVKVFILAGQSNMEGRGFPEPLAWQVTQDEFRSRYTHFIKDGDFEAFNAKVKETTDENNRRSPPTYLWSKRKDVWINYLGKHGDLTVGYGAPREGFGPEFNFGHVIGNYYDEQVLIIKTSWGGRALARGFLPPSSMASNEEYQRQTDAFNAEVEEWNKAEPARIEAYNKRVTEQNRTQEKKRPLRTFKPKDTVTLEEYKLQFGKDYRNMVNEVHTCLEEIKDRFPGYRGQGYEIAGFVWFQGWNDQYNDRWLSYEANLANLMRDVRAEFKAPDMSIVVGQMGQDGMKVDKKDSPRDFIKKAQASVPVSDEFKANAVCVHTDQYWDKHADAIYRGPGGWSKDVARWRQHGNDHPYHYYGSPWCFAQIGTAFGEAMVKLNKAQD